MFFEVKIPSRPLDLREVTRGLWVAEKPKTDQYYGYFDLLPAFTKSPSHERTGEHSGNGGDGSLSGA